jgi:hypothetical protein
MRKLERWRAGRLSEALDAFANSDVFEENVTATATATAFVMLRQAKVLISRSRAVVSGGLQEECVNGKEK